jgi:hypothetical protein
MSTIMSRKAIILEMGKGVFQSWWYIQDMPGIGIIQPNGRESESLPRRIPCMSGACSGSTRLEYWQEDGY